MIIVFFFLFDLLLQKKHVFVSKFHYLFDEGKLIFF